MNRFFYEKKKKKKRKKGYMLKTSASIHTITLYISIIRVEEIFTHVFVHACMPVHVDMWVSGGRGARGKGGAGEGVGVGGGGGQGGGGGAIYLEHSKSAFTQKKVGSINLIYSKQKSAFKNENNKHN